MQALWDIIFERWEQEEREAQKRRKRFLEVGLICETCYGMLNNHKRSDILVSLEVIRSKTSCQLCQLLVSCIDPWILSIETDAEARSRSLRICTMKTAIKIYLTDTAGSDTFCCIGSVVVHATEVDLHAEQPRSAARQDGNLDATWLRDWLVKCGSEHKHHLRDCFARFRLPIDITLIDVESYCLVKKSTSDRYLTLSYVWGPAESFLATTENQRSLEQPGSLRQAPLGRLILDAMELVRRIGERYLWVDALCIQRDNTLQKQAQVSSMDIIYNQSLATIVASTAKSTDSYLPGIGQPTIHYRRTNVGHGLILSLEPPELWDIQQGTPAIETRGWTFQERLLSRRCLFVNHQGTYLDCPSAVVCPTGEVCDYDECNNHVSVMYYNPDLGVFGDWNTKWEEFTSLVEDFSIRHLTRSDDTINALNGLLNVFSAALGGEMIAGMPEAYFDEALLFEHESFDLGTRNAHFPSWSWAGWTGRCYYWELSDRGKIHSAVSEYSWMRITSRRRMRRMTKAADRGRAAEVTIEHLSEQSNDGHDILFFEADVVNMSHLPTRQRSIYHLTWYGDLGALEELDYVLLSTWESDTKTLCNALLIKWSGEYAERLHLDSYISLDNWQKYKKKRKQIALR